MSTALFTQRLHYCALYSRNCILCPKVSQCKCVSVCWITTLLCSPPKWREPVGRHISTPAYTCSSNWANSLELVLSSLHSYSSSSSLLLMLHVHKIIQHTAITYIVTHTYMYFYYTVHSNAIAAAVLKHHNVFTLHSYSKGKLSTGY